MCLLYGHNRWHVNNMTDPFPVCRVFFYFAKLLSIEKDEEQVKERNRKILIELQKIGEKKKHEN